MGRRFYASLLLFNKRLQKPTLGCLFEPLIRKRFNLFETVSSIHLNLHNSVSPSLRRRANARNVSTSFLPYGGITYFINSFDYPYLLCFNSPPTQHQFL